MMSNMRFTNSKKIPYANAQFCASTSCAANINALKLDTAITAVSIFVVILINTLPVLPIILRNKVITGLLIVLVIKVIILVNPKLKEQTQKCFEPAV